MKPRILALILLLISGNIYTQPSWIQQPSGLQNSYGGAIWPVNKDTVYAITTGEFSKTTDGQNWSRQTINFNVSFYDITFMNDELGFAVGDYGTIIKTADGGNTWEQMNTGTSEMLVSVCVAPPNTVWATGNNGTVLFSTDYGNSWIKKPGLSNKMLSSIRFKDSSFGMIAGNARTLLKTLDGGQTWVSISGISPDSLEDFFSISFTNNKTYFLGGYNSVSHSGGFYIYQTDDNINFSRQEEPYFRGGVQSLIFTTDFIGFAIDTFAITDKAEVYLFIYKTDDGGQSWGNNLVAWDPPGGYYSGIGKIAFATDSIGYALAGCAIYKTEDGGTYVDTDKKSKDESFSIFPNPVRSEQIHLNIDPFEGRDYLLEIVDISGKSVLNQRIFQKDVTLTISDLQEGFYLVRLLDQNDLIETQKLLVMKER